MTYLEAKQAKQQSISKRLGDKNMAKTTAKLTMRFSEQDYQAMQHIAEHRDCSMAQIVRDALKEYLPQANPG
ncbi:MAG: hypothetical protein RM049_18435 [Nostoc sp. DedQUE04]|nr:hypothetical protein [Nostoc sp. DedQUE04]